MLALLNAEPIQLGSRNFPSSEALLKSNAPQVCRLLMLNFLQPARSSSGTAGAMRPALCALHYALCAMLYAPCAMRYAIT